MPSTRPLTESTKRGSGRSRRNPGVAGGALDGGERSPVKWVILGPPMEFYVDPLTVSGFPSKKGVMQHLSVGNSCSPECNKKRRKQSNIKVVPQIVCSPDWLPQGWTTEMRFRNSNDRVRKDVYYTDPVSGYIFRSRNAVFRYLQTGLICTRVYRSKRQCLPDKYSSEQFQLPIADEERSSKTNVRRCLFPGQASSSKEKVIEFGEHSSRAYIPCGDGAGSCSSTPLSIECFELGSTSKIQMWDFRHPAGYGSQWQSLKPGQEDFMGPATSVLALPASRKSLGQSNATSEEAKLSTGNVESGKRKRGRPRKQGRNTTPDPSNRMPVKPVKPRAKKAISMPVRASKRLAGLKPDPVSLSRIGDRSLRARAKHIAHAKDSEWSGGAAGLTDEPEAMRLVDDEEKPPLALPFEDSLMDPCLQFAIKTLTGDIPLVEESAAIHDYFHQHFSSVQSTSQVSSQPH